MQPDSVSKNSRRSKSSSYKCTAAIPTISMLINTGLANKLQKPGLRRFHRRRPLRPDWTVKVQLPAILRSIRAKPGVVEVERGRTRGCGPKRRPKRTLLGLALRQTGADESGCGCEQNRSLVKRSHRRRANPPRTRFL